VRDILNAVHPQDSPLVYARDAARRFGLKPPVVTDEYWLDIVEASNEDFDYRHTRWSFPLPEKDGSAEARGERLAWTAMQSNWVRTAEDAPITPLSPPEQVHAFISSHPGLSETCCDFPELLVEYAPQLTIPGFEGELLEVIEKTYQLSLAKFANTKKEKSAWGSALMTTNKSPTCAGIWALRHADFGSYQPESVAHRYFCSEMFGPRVSPYEDTDHGDLAIIDGQPLATETNTRLFAARHDEAAHVAVGICRNGPWWEMGNQRHFVHGYVQCQ